MPHAPSFVRTACGIVSCAFAALVSSAAPAQTIDLSLNVHYADPEDILSGGTWDVVAKSSHFGISALSLRLTNIVAVPPAQNEAPRGTVNGSDPAGFGSIQNDPFPGYRNITIFQVPIPPPQFGPGNEQSLFYGVGTVMNGMPGDVGPAFTSLTNVQDVPWATGDVFGNNEWDTAATFVSGTFAAGVTPGFFAGTSGQVFTTLGTSTTIGNIELATISTIVRTNSTAVLPDYNGNGVVDAADYVLWRAGSPVADGNNNSVIDQGDYDLWREHFGEIVPGAGAGASLPSGAVPEPTTAALLALGTALLLAHRHRRTAQASQPASSIQHPQG